MHSIILWLHTTRSFIHPMLFLKDGKAVGMVGEIIDLTFISKFIYCFLSRIAIFEQS